ncbi:MAG: hypothetical protein IPG96_18610 [Proteobacteria bacterium]|nr:hypothetical protein [Pseudomonadota bacterium]
MKSPSSVQLSWEDTNRRETGYLVERSLSPTTGFVALPTTAADATGLLDEGLTPDTSYYYRVRAAGADKRYSKYSQVVGATTPKQTETPLVVVLTAPETGLTVTEAKTLDVVAQVPAGATIESVDFFDGTTLLATVTAAPFSASWTVTAGDNGSHTLSAQVTAVDGGSASSNPVTISINIPSTDKTAPTVALINPAAGTTITAPQTTNITATATDNLAVIKVEFYDGVRLLGTVATSPYSWAWVVSGAADNGTHVLTAKAIDADGNSATSTPLTVTVNIVSTDTTAPTVALTATPPGPSYTGTQNVTVRFAATATDEVGVTRVEFYDGTTMVGTPDASRPYGRNWVLTPATVQGSHTLTAKAFDAAGNSATSRPIVVTVNITAGGDTTPPTVALSPLAPAGPYATAQTVTIAATASDAVGVSRVAFYDGATLLGSDTSSPYEFSWAVTAAANGSHTVTAKAFDAAGNSATSPGITATVNITVPMGQVTLAWDDDENPTSALGGYELHYGRTKGGPYTSIKDLGMNKTGTVTDLAKGETFYFVALAYDTSKTLKSAFSNEVTYTVP